jgi:hypothetical protein
MGWVTKAIFIFVALFLFELAFGAPDLTFEVPQLHDDRGAAAA